MNTMKIMGALLVWSCVLVSVTYTQPAPQAQAAAGSLSPEDQQGSDLLMMMCTSCHDASFADTRRTKADWQDVISKMIEYGASGDPKDFATVHAYLVRNHGLLNINDAPSDEIAMGLGLTAKDADAIVAFRMANGKFADLEAVKKVPGIDLKAVDAHKDGLRF
jgi:competence ComEA-like helix-hairpin-helix protein